MTLALRALIVEDSEDDTLLLLRELRRGGYDVTFERVDTAGAMTAALASREWDVVIADYSMPHFSGTDALNLLKEKRLDLPFIFVSGTIGEETAVAAMKGGAHDYVMKGNLSRLVPAIQRELREAEVRRERRRFEKQLGQLQKFEAIGKLAGGIAHDFNNVLGAILGWAELGLEETPPGTRLHSLFQKINDQAHRAAGLTRQLLAFARRQMLEPRNLNLNEIISEVTNLLQKVIGEQVELKMALAPDLAVCRADPTQVEQVLMNLCLNARDAMRDGGRLTIETQNATLDEEYCRIHPYAKPGRYVLVSVSDTGVGMDAATLEHLFEPFFTTKETGKGTGLGLATVYGIVKQHGGLLHAYSEPGHGATFRVYLPVGVGATEPEAKPSAEPARSGTETILVAEDHQGIQEMVREVLEKLGYKILMAPDGEQAVRLFEQHHDHIALLLLDVVMPKLNGPETYARMCAIHPDVPVIFATGYSAESEQLRSCSDKAACILQKPYTPSMLSRKVREVLDRKSAS